MGILGTTLRVVVAMVAMTVVLWAYAHAAGPVVPPPRLFGAALSGLATGLVGAGFDGTMGVAWTRWERLVFWGLLGALVVYAAETVIPGMGLSIWPALAAGAAVGLVEAALPPEVTRL
jgi:hypothetical protein